MSISTQQRRTMAIILLWGICCAGRAAEVLFIGDSPEDAAYRRPVDVACRFYGLELHQVCLSERGTSASLANALNESQRRVLVVTARALVTIARRHWDEALQAGKAAGLPLLIIGLDSETSPTVLSRWSNGAVVGVASAENLGRLQGARLFQFADWRGFMRELDGQVIPSAVAKAWRLLLEGEGRGQPLIREMQPTRALLPPLFVRAAAGKREVFLLARFETRSKASSPSADARRENFLEIAPILLFLRYACGDICWHAESHFANLTIDDPWLTNPYGSLDFKKLVAQMDRVNFHTTIAFIPWNYDRSEPDAAALFRDRPDRLSLCVHGNNHDHQEFYRYTSAPDDPFPAKPLSLQEANIKQALARMSAFSKRTELPYDPVMVFPHGIAPMETLGLLKRYNFLATSNAVNLPLGSSPPDDPVFDLRAVSLRFANFPSLRRAPASVSEPDLAIQLFLDNPVLLYGHHDLFSEGIDAFNKTAATVNRLDPDVIWQGLGHISRHLYLVRSRDESQCDVWAFCRSFVLENTAARQKTYSARKEESGSPPIRRVTVDDRPCPYKAEQGHLLLDVTVDPGKSRQVDIEYKNDLDLGAVDISKGDKRVNWLRKVSDFRDLTLSATSTGRLIVRAYYAIGFKGLAVTGLLLSVLTATGAMWLLTRRFRRRKSRGQVNSV